MTEVITEIIDPITEITVGPEIGMVTEMAIDITIDQITKGTMAIKDMVIEAKIVVDLGTETEEIGVAQEKVLHLGVAPKTDTKVEGRVEMTLGSGTGLNLDLDPLLVWVPIEIEADVIDAMSTITLPENVLNNNAQGRSTHSTEDSLLILCIHSIIQMEKILT